jgi:beta-lactamase regulating signal transducer with metallopeptidase domain
MNPLADAVTAALLHSLWQGAALALILSITLFALRRFSPHTRYLVNLVALGLTLVIPITTTWAVPPLSPDSESAGNAYTAILSLEALVRSAGSTALPEAAMSWLLLAWAMGVVVFSLRLTAASVRVGHLRRAPKPGSDTLERAREIARRMGITRPFEVVDAAVDSGPGVAGCLRPVIFLPSAAILGLGPGQLEALVAHELAHIRRHDYAVNACQMVIEALLFFNPAVWWISSRVREERELACDDMAVSVTGDPLVYARALTSVEKLRSVPQPMPGIGGRLAYRILRIAGVEAAERRPLSAFSGLIPLLIVAAFTVGISGTLTGRPVSTSLQDARQATEEGATIGVRIGGVGRRAPEEQEEEGPQAEPQAQVGTESPSGLQIQRITDVPAFLPRLRTAMTRASFDIFELDAWAIFQGTSQSSYRLPERFSRESAGSGDLFWFVHDGRDYMITDGGTVEQIGALIDASVANPRALEQRLEDDRSQLAALESSAERGEIAIGAAKLVEARRIAEARRESLERRLSNIARIGNRAPELLRERLALAVSSGLAVPAP